jgi:hypothetical protein
MEKEQIIIAWLARMEQHLPDVDCNSLELGLRSHIDEAERMGVKDLDAHLRRGLPVILECLRNKPRPK